MMKRPSLPSVSLTALCALVALCACDDDKLVDTDGQGAPPAAQTPPPQDTTPEDTTPPIELPEGGSGGDGMGGVGGKPVEEGGGGGGGGEIPQPDPLTLELFGPDTVELAPGALREVSVRLRQGELPVADKQISFALEGEPVGSQLTAATSLTDANGIAKISVAAGDASAQFTVVASAPDTNEVRVTVVVSVDPHGSVTVRVSYSQSREQPLSGVDVYIFDGNSCDELLNAPRLPTALAARQLADINGSASFPGLDDGKVITTVAQGKAGAQVAAAGCVQGTIVAAGRDTPVTVPLTLFGLNLTGEYTLETTYDLHEAIPGTVGTVVTYVHDIFGDQDDPARWIVQWISTELDFDLGAFEQTAIGLVDGLLHQYLPDTAWYIFDVLGDITNTIFNLKVTSTARVSPAGQGAWNVNETWDDLTYLWTNGCDPRQNPGCDEHLLPLRNTDLRPIAYDYLVHNDPADRTALQIDRHDIEVEYGRLFQVFLEEIVYPALAGVHSTEELLGTFVSCEDIAESLDCSDSNGCDGYFSVGGLDILRNQDMEGACDGALGAIAGVIDASIGGIGASGLSVLTVEGSCTIADRDQNNEVDTWSDGELSGTVNVDGGRPVSAVLEGERN